MPKIQTIELNLGQIIARNEVKIWAISISTSGFCDCIIDKM